MLKLLKLIPIWGYVIALLVAGWGVTAYRLNSAQADKAKALQRVAEFQEAIATQKVEAGKLLAVETSKVTEAEARLAAALSAQNAKDKDNGQTIETLRGQLATAGRLRDPNATTGCRSSSGSTASATRPAAGGSAASAAETGGLLSEQLSGLLKRLFHEADEINRAYASCRADNLELRSKLPP